MNQLRQAARETREALGLNFSTAATVVVAIAVAILIHGYFLDPDTGSVPSFALWLIESIARALAVAAVFAPLLLWNLIKVVRRQRLIDASRRIATERAASVDDQRIGNSRNNIIVHLTDAYQYSLTEFYARPSELKAGSFVVIGMPHANAYDDVIEEARKGRIGVSHIGKFMGALNYRRLWEYWNPEERRRSEEKAKQYTVQREIG